MYNGSELSWAAEAARRRSLCERLEEDFIREMAMMKYLCAHDSHVVPFYGACVYDGRLCLVLELMKVGRRHPLMRTTGQAARCCFQHLPMCTVI